MTLQHIEFIGGPNDGATIAHAGYVPPFYEVAVHPDYTVPRVPGDVAPRVPRIHLYHREVRARRVAGRTHYYVVYEHSEVH